MSLPLPALINDKDLPRRRKAARPAEIQAAALSLFAEKGFAATRLDDVAGRAGVSKGTVYLYFESKEELFRSVIREGIVPVLAQGEQLAAEYSGSTGELLRILLHRWWERIGATDLVGVPKVMVSEARNFPELGTYYFEHVILPARRLLRGVLERGIARGEFRDVPLESALETLFGPLLLLVIWKSSLGVCCPSASLANPAQMIDQHLDLVLNGLERKS